MPSNATRLFLRELHDKCAKRTFSGPWTPPQDNGTTWSKLALTGSGQTMFSGTGSKHSQHIQLSRSATSALRTGPPTDAPFFKARRL